MTGAGQRDARPARLGEGERGGRALQRRRPFRAGDAAVAARGRIDEEADAAADVVDLAQPSLAAAIDQRGVEADGSLPFAGDGVLPERLDAEGDDLSGHGRPHPLPGGDQTPEGMRTTTAPSATRRMSSSVACETVAS